MTPARRGSIPLLPLALPHRPATVCTSRANGLEVSVGILSPPTHMEEKMDAGRMMREAQVKAASPSQVETARQEPNLTSVYNRLKDQVDRFGRLCEGLAEVNARLDGSPEPLSETKTTPGDGLIFDVQRETELLGHWNGVFEHELIRIASNLGIES